MSATTSAPLVMLAAGIGVPVLGALNAALGQKLGSPAAAALILFLVALLTATITFAVVGGSFRGITAVPAHLFLGGVLVAFYVLSITWIAPGLGIGNAIFFVLLGQIVSAALIDHFALFGARHSPVGAVRLAGMLMMVVGIFLTQVAGRD
jgi:transporter family-2 protein